MRCSDAMMRPDSKARRGSMGPIAGQTWSSSDGTDKNWRER